MTKEGTKERTKLKAARVERGLSQSELADAIKYSREAINAWERGKMDPGTDAIGKLCVFFGKNPADLDLAKDLTEDELRMIEEILKNRVVDRRQALGIVALPAFAGVNITTSLSKPLVSPGAFLRLCRASIDGCWRLLKHDGFIEAHAMLTENMTTLSDLATHSSPCQNLAAALAAEAKFLLSVIAMHSLQYTCEETLYSDAIHFAEMSGD